MRNQCGGAIFRSLGAKGSLAKRQGTSRVDGRFNELKSIVDQNVHGRFRITSSLAHNDIIRKESINSYFDLGCGNGLITCRIGTHFDLSPENIFGGDVFNSKNPELTFVSIDSDQALIDLGTLHCSRDAMLDVSLAS